MGNLTSLRRLELIDLMLDNSEALTLLDDVCCECCTTLRYLSLLNFTKNKCQLLHVGVFLNLQVRIFIRTKLHRYRYPVSLTYRKKFEISK